MHKTLTLLVTLLLFAPGAWSTEPAPVTDKLSMHTSQTIKLTAVVEAINHETREVTLRGPEGNSVSLVVREDARNLSQVKAGDILNVEYVQSLSIEVVADDGSTPGVGQLVAAARTEKGAMPGLAVVDATVITATVEEINLENNTFKLKGPDGVIQEYIARDPENLKKAAVGDIVITTITETYALSIEKANVD